MGLMGSALGRGLAGAGEAASGLANKYIDQELAAEKARMLADLQHNSAVKLDQYNMSPERQAKLRTNATDATLAQGDATRQSELAGLKDEPYQAALKGKEDSDAAADTQREIDKIKALTPAQIEAKNAATKGTMTIEAQREALIAEARERMKAKYDRRLDGAGGGAGMKLPPGVKAMADRLEDDLKQSNAAIVKSKAEGNWDPARNPSQKELAATQAARQLQYQQLLAPYLPGAKSAGADPLGIMGADAAAPTAAPAAAAKPAAPGGRPLMKAAEEKVDPIRGMDVRTLKRIASVDGHAQQAVAKQELERRREQPADEVDTTTFGFGA